MEQMISMQLEYESIPSLMAMDPEKYALIRGDGPLDLPEKQSDLVNYGSYTGVGYVSDLKRYTDAALLVRISRVRGSFLEDLPKLGAEVPPATVVNVVIPNAALFSVTELVVLENECTDVVNSHLNDGWRIVAVCPPNDTRRPTYILGRMRP